ncbi:hypothetical protein V1264_004527 [Littorina saxatilis]
MKMLFRVEFGLCACILFTVTSSVSGRQDPVSEWKSASSRPNVLFLVVDDLRPKLGCYGETNMVTPNIDQLAASSVRFDRAYVQFALCGPSRTSFLTSRRPESTRVFNLYTYWRDVAGNYTTLPQHFKQSGYITQSVGKVFHPGKSSGGDDDYPLSWTNKPYHGDKGGNSGYKNNSEQCPGPDGKLHDYAVCPVNVSQTPHKILEDIDLADFSVDFLKNYRHKYQDQPFFFAVGFHKPHLIWKYPVEYEALYPLTHITLPKDKTKPEGMPPVAWYTCTGLREHQDIMDVNFPFPYGPLPDDMILKIRQAYSASTSYVDAQIGRVLSALDQYGYANNTIITFIGDHGWNLGEHGEWCKQTNFELAVRIPYLVHVPNVTSRFRQRGHNFPFIDALHPKQVQKVSDAGLHLSTDVIVEAVDLYPTISELAGVDVPSRCPLNGYNTAFCTEGSSLVSILKNLTTAAPVQWENIAYSQYPRWSPDPHKGSPSVTIMGYTLRNPEYRYTEWVYYNHTAYTMDWTQLYGRELYVHTTDPAEDNNVAAQSAYQAVVEQLSKQLHQGIENRE